MQAKLPQHYTEIAQSMGISLYQRFSLSEASLFLRCSTKDIEKLCADAQLNYIEIAESHIQFFGFQLLEYLLAHISENDTPVIQETSPPERIIRAKELQDMTGLSRTTLWRLEKTGKFPSRVSLGVGSVGWRWSEVSAWLENRKKVQ